MLIGVSGYTEDVAGTRGSAGAGKDLVADYLVEHHGFVKVALADEIKRIAMRLWRFSERTLWGASDLRNVFDERYPLKRPMRQDFPNGKEGLSSYREELSSYERCPFLTPRRALQQIGTEVARKVDPDVWIRFALEVASTIHTTGASYTRVAGLSKSSFSRSYYRGVVISDVRFPNEMKGIEKQGGRNWRKKRRLTNLPGVPATHVSEISLLDVPDTSFDAVLPDTSPEHLRLFIARVMDVYNGKISTYDPGKEKVPPFKR